MDYPDVNIARLLYCKNAKLAFGLIHEHIIEIKPLPGSWTRNGYFFPPPTVGSNRIFFMQGPQMREIDLKYNEF